METNAMVQGVFYDDCQTHYGHARNCLFPANCAHQRQFSSISHVFIAIAVERFEMDYLTDKQKIPN